MDGGYTVKTHASSRLVAIQIEVIHCIRNNRHRRYCQSSIILIKTHFQYITLFIFTMYWKNSHPKLRILTVYPNYSNIKLVNTTIYICFLVYLLHHDWHKAVFTYAFTLLDRRTLLWISQSPVCVLDQNYIYHLIELIYLMTLLQQKIPYLKIWIWVM